MAKKTGLDREKILDLCFDCFCKNGLERTSTKMLTDACKMSTGNIFHYFATKDEIVIQATARGMAKVEDEFMEKAPKSIDDVQRFLEEVPYWTAKEHGAKYRFMYQVYTSPTYREHGKKFFAGVRERYTEYAKQLEPRLHLPWQTIQAFIYIVVRACVHYAMFEDEEYLKPQIALIANALPLIMEKQSIPPKTEN